MFTLAICDNVSDTRKQNDNENKMALLEERLKGSFKDLHEKEFICDTVANFQNFFKSFF